MFLSKVFVDWQWSKNPYQIHRALWRLFPNQSDAEREFLFRVEHAQPGRGSLLLLQSEMEPISAEVANVVASKLVNYEISHDALLRFRLRANPIKTIKDERQRVNARGEIKSCRVPLVHEEEQLQWLERKLLGAASLQFAQAIKEAPLFFRKQDRGGKIQPICFEGVLTVTDPGRFQSLLTQGVGPAKGMGCGLLSVARA